MLGYRDGVTQANEDLIKYNEEHNIPIYSEQDKIICPPDSSKDYCNGYKDGYVATVIDVFD